jgi:hypothetical protein
MISPRLAQERVSLAYEQSMAKLQEEAEAAEAELKKKLEQFARNHARGEIENQKDAVDAVPVLDTTISGENESPSPEMQLQRRYEGQNNELTSGGGIMLFNHSNSPLPHGNLRLLHKLDRAIE